MHGSKDIFHSITATPIVGNGSYIEILPCAELLPYIRCFWRKDVKTERESLIHLTKKHIYQIPMWQQTLRRCLVYGFTHGRQDCLQKKT